MSAAAVGVGVEAGTEASMMVCVGGGAMGKLGARKDI